MLGILSNEILVLLLHGWIDSTIDIFHVDVAIVNKSLRKKYLSCLKELATKGINLPFVVKYFPGREQLVVWQEKRHCATNLVRNLIMRVTTHTCPKYFHHFKHLQELYFDASNYYLSSFHCEISFILSAHNFPHLHTLRFDGVRLEFPTEIFTSSLAINRNSILPTKIKTLSFINMRSSQNTSAVLLRSIKDLVKAYRWMMFHCPYTTKLTIDECKDMRYTLLKYIISLLPKLQMVQVHAMKADEDFVFPKPPQVTFSHQTTTPPTSFGNMGTLKPLVEYGHLQDVTLKQFTFPQMVDVLLHCNHLHTCHLEPPLLVTTTTQVDQQQQQQQLQLFSCEPYIIEKLLEKVITLKWHKLQVLTMIFWDDDEFNTLLLTKIGEYCPSLHTFQLQNFLPSKYLSLSDEFYSLLIEAKCITTHSLTSLSFLDIVVSTSGMQIMSQSSFLVSHLLHFRLEESTRVLSSPSSPFADKYLQLLQTFNCLQSLQLKIAPPQLSFQERACLFQFLTVLFGNEMLYPLQSTLQKVKISVGCSLAPNLMRKLSSFRDEDFFLVSNGRSNSPQQRIKKTDQNTKMYDLWKFEALPLLHIFHFELDDEIDWFPLSFQVLLQGRLRLKYGKQLKELVVEASAGKPAKKLPLNSQSEEH